ncbi:DUF3606 domain-containing protein [Mucilaginibacter polytrichastri]|uniref:Uncharacterized protein n=1 Tax=Mucilaginibacter polytrichastri TaxID=1302689 RepID=A0A1Q6A6N2_9SPHI|nr:DUF3606 domain-containing protein [Mucilaginibacter polytrichastri]OKS89670.1 hypothetical protein RG47T_5155 [Mucilaginibacter polytrichastri]SFT24911.1 Protein of unknown function [Mucilaginibacter polytrichastri]
MDELMKGKYRNILTINLNKDNEVQDWSQKWLVTAEQIREAQQKANHNSIASIHEALTQLGYL